MQLPPLVIDDFREEGERLPRFAAGRFENDNTYN